MPSTRTFAPFLIPSPAYIARAVQNSPLPTRTVPLPPGSMGSVTTALAPVMPRCPAYLSPPRNESRFSNAGLKTSMLRTEATMKPMAWAVSPNPAKANTSATTAPSAKKSKKIDTERSSPANASPANTAQKIMSRFRLLPLPEKILHHPLAAPSPYNTAVQQRDLGAKLDGYLGDVPGMAHRGGAAFLARGEYSLNYLVRKEPQEEPDLVARLVTGSQMGLPLEEQAPYEHHALGLLAPSSVTPRPYHVDPCPEGLPYPLILEEYLPGRPLDYATDLAAAACCLAAVHALGVPPEHRLQTHPDPAPAILEESRGLTEPYFSWDGASEGSKGALREGFARIEGFLGRGDLFAGADLAIVNYDLNTHNFVVEDGEAKLLDWEKARIAPRTQDLAHFLLPTTTLWRDETAALLSETQEDDFVGAYLQLAPVGDGARFREQLEAMKTIVSLRAVSWCAWAVQETARAGRPIANEETLNRSRRYLEPNFLGGLFGA